MDLKGTTNLDPKLKETYERVMGTSFTPPPPPAQPAATVPNTQAPAQPPPVQPLHVTSVEEPQPAQPLPPTQPSQALESHPVSAPEMVASPQIFSSTNPFEATTPPPGEVLANNAVVPGKKSNHFIVIGLVVGGIIFFAVYAFIWAKVFGIF